MRRAQHSLFLLTAAAFCMAGCGRSTEPEDVQAATLDEDVAVTVAGFLSGEGGGMADQFEDISHLASATGLWFGTVPGDPLRKGMAGELADTSYDDATGWWTATLTRTRSSLLGLYESSFTREYRFQFLDASGQPQRRYIVQTPAGPDTAHTINFRVVSGTGFHRSPIRVHYLESLNADWVITHANTPVLLINGTSSRTGKDTLTTRESVRTHANTMTTTLVDVTKPRYRLGATTDDISGTITGVYSATITFSRGDLYRERTVERQFTVDLTADDARIGVGGRQFRIGWKRGEFFGFVR